MIGGSTPDRLLVFPQGFWADYVCSPLQHYVCEVRGCPAGWTAHGGSCYMFAMDQLDYDGASAACAAQGSTLVHVRLQAIPATFRETLGLFY